MIAPKRDAGEALDLAVSAALLAWQEARTVLGPEGARADGFVCGQMYPFGTDGDAPCPVCYRPVFTHLGFPAGLPVGGTK